MKKLKNFKILWKYLSHDKLKLFLYLFLVVITYVPALLLHAETKKLRKLPEFMRFKKRYQ